MTIIGWEAGFIQADLDIRAAKILNAEDLDAVEKLERKIV